MATITSPRTESPAGYAGVTSPPAPSSPSLTGTETSTSSVRPSIDLSRNDSTASKPAANPAQRRNRAALRDYYKLKSQPAPAEEGLNRTASLASNASDSTTTTIVTSTTPTGNINDAASPILAQLDDASFDADKFIASLLSSASLRDILRTEGTLVSEIRNLDGERKALVYDNYSKLIKAVGTIGEMQKGMQRKAAGGEGGLDDGVEKLEGKMERLQVLVKEIGPRAVEGAGPEAEAEAERKKKKTTTMRRKQRQLVQWVLAASGRLERLCRDGKRAEAELEWAQVKQLLDRWGEVEGVDKVRQACAEAMKESRRSDDG